MRAKTNLGCCYPVLLASIVACSTVGPPAVMPAEAGSDGGPDAAAADAACVAANGKCKGSCCGSDGLTGLLFHSDKQCVEGSSRLLGCAPILAGGACQSFPTEEGCVYRSVDGGRDIFLTPVLYSKADLQDFEACDPGLAQQVIAASTQTRCP